jgi:hypothetical protein
MTMPTFRKTHAYKLGVEAGQRCAGLRYPGDANLAGDRAHTMGLISDFRSRFDDESWQAYRGRSKTIDSHYGASVSVFAECHGGPCENQADFDDAALCAIEWWALLLNADGDSELEPAAARVLGGWGHGHIFRVTRAVTLRQDS